MNLIDVSAVIAELNSGSDDRAEAAALQLSSGGSQSLPVIQELLNHASPEVRWWAVRALAEIESPGSAVMLIDSLADPDTTVRQCAALALRGRPDSNAVSPLVQALSARDQLLARLAADALIAIGADAVPALIRVMGDGSQPARIQAVRALAEIGDTRAVPVLFAALDEDSALIEHWAGLGLQNMGVNMVFFNP